MIEVIEVNEISKEEFESEAGAYPTFLFGISITTREEDGEEEYFYIANPAYVPRVGETYLSPEQLQLLLKKVV